MRLLTTAVDLFVMQKAVGDVRGVIVVAAERRAQRVTARALIGTAIFRHRLRTAGSIIMRAALYACGRHAAMCAERDDGVLGLGCVDAIEPDRVRRIIAPRVNVVDQPQCMNRVVILDFMREIPCDALATPEPHQEPGIAFAGLHGERPLRVRSAQVARVQLEGAGQNVVFTHVFAEDRIGDVDDGCGRKHPPRDPFLDHAECVDARQLVQHESAVGGDLVDCGDDRADRVFAIVVVDDMEGNWQPAQRLERQTHVGRQAFERVSQRFANAFATNEPQREKCAVREAGVGGERDPKQPLGLGEGRRELIELPGDCRQLRVGRPTRQAGRHRHG